MSAENPVKVSVVTTTYNQESLIGAALDSVLMQECNFAYEYIIGEDCSTDHTREVLKEYQARYPDLIQLVLRDENVGAQRNLGDVLTKCKGEYVALLDGDDFWTSSLKLQKQVDFMEAHPDCALSCHDVRVVDACGEPLGVEFDAVPERSEIQDLLKGNFISACSVMYRWGLVEKIPDWWYDMWIGDYSLHVMHAQYGWIGHLDEALAAYRVHDAGLWSGERAAVRMNEFIKTLRNLDETLGFRYHDVIERSIYTHRFGEFAVRFDTASMLREKGEGALAGPHINWLVKNIGRRGDIPLNAIVVLVLRGTCPWLIKPLVETKRVMRRLVGGQSQGKADDNSDDLRRNV